MPDSAPSYQTLSHFAPHDVFKTVNVSLSDGVTAVSYPLYPKYSTPLDPLFVQAQSIDSRPIRTWSGEVVAANDNRHTEILTAPFTEASPF